MKKVLLSAFIAITSFSAANAQSTLTAATNNPVASDVFVGHSTDTTGFSVGASGASATWNYGMLVSMGTDTTTFSTCAATPYCDSFSGSNLASFDGMDYAYLIASTAKLQAIGGQSDTDFVHFSDPKDFMRYPFTYNNSFTDTTMVSMGLFDLQMIDSVTADGWGTLTTPGGTYTNALRVHAINYQDVIVMGMPYSSSRYETYNWYAPGFHYALMTVNIDTAGTGTNHVTGVTYYTGPTSTTKVGNVNRNGVAMNIAPNPATNAAHVTFSLATTEGAFVTVTDLTGRTVATVNNLTKGANNVTINTNDLSAGIYVVQLHTAEGVTAQKLVVSK